ncbi:hypothetical protein [Janthinobacterium sp. DSP2-3-3]|uniref:hypothetical protein n=1 Tax=Janthinobacterium sp. DSP2-3-3 TaxID=2804596 RepID=UPI003CFB22DD
MISTAYPATHALSGARGIGNCRIALDIGPADVVQLLLCDGSSLLARAIAAAAAIEQIMAETRYQGSFTFERRIRHSRKWPAPASPIRAWCWDRRRG